MASHVWRSGECCCRAGHGQERLDACYCSPTKITTGKNILPSCWSCKCLFSDFIAETSGRDSTLLFFTLQFGLKIQGCSLPTVEFYIALKILLKVCVSRELEKGGLRFSIAGGWGVGFEVCRQSVCILLIRIVVCQYSVGSILLGSPCEIETRLIP